ncbi:MAG TPA: ABC transporter permease [Sporichthyaceae bacterium]|jgi:peptide/nickel transport system permease protein
MSASTGSPTRALLRNPLGAAGALVLLLFVVAGLAGPVLAPYDATQVDVVSGRLAGPSASHWLGTDQLGRDIASRILIGSRDSLRVAVVAVAIATVLGSTAGLLAGYRRGWLDALLMRSMDVLFAFPAILVAIAVLAVRGPGPTNASLALGLVYTPIFARVARAGALSVRESGYVQAARAAGARDRRILWRHVLPNVSGPIIVQISLSLAFALLAEAALSFLGLGTQPPHPSWGGMLSDGRDYLQQAWWMAAFPGLAIFFVVLACNLVGDALRDALDPRER